MRFRHLIPFAAILIAAFVATLLATVSVLHEFDEPWTIMAVSEVIRTARLVFVLTLAHALLFGLPLFFFLRSRIRVGLIVCLIAGFLVGATPLACIGLLSMFGVNNASTNGIPTIVNGIPTLAGLLALARSASLFGAFGLAAGLTFWFVLRSFDRLAMESDAKRADREIPRTKSWLLASGTLLSTCVALVLPSFIHDNSCHNLFRDGRTTVRPEVFGYIDLNAEEWPRLTEIFRDFGSAHSLELRADQNARNGKLFWRDLNLCNEQGVAIEALDQPWLADVKSPTPKGVLLSFYEMKPGSEWGSLARDLVGKIDVVWPEKIKFHGPDGKIIPEVEALRGRSR
jgi:hypothetical protein